MFNRRVGLLSPILLGAAMLTAAAPDRQLAIVESGTGGPEVLKLKEVPVLAPGAGQVLIRVHAAAVNPVDWKMRQSRRPEPSVATSPVERIPGFDAAGVIESIGPGVEAFKVGDPVFTMIGRIRTAGLNGTYSRYVIAPVSNTVMKPPGMSFAEAAGLGTTGMTAARVMHHIKPGPGQRVFIDGAAGGVGSAAVQIAKAQGAFVIGTASARHHDYLRSLGIDQIIDYTQIPFETALAPVDAVIETVSRENAVRALVVLKSGGVLASIVGTPSVAQCAAASVHCPSSGPPGPEELDEGELLREVGNLARQGKLAVHIDRVFSLAQAGEAQALGAQGHTQGKIILIVLPEDVAANP
jgi:NADPH:quinone reductase-like Zn-dependent oxidoreductase